MTKATYKVMRIHLVNGTHVDSKTITYEKVLESVDEMEVMKDGLQVNLTSSANYQIHFDRPNDGWCIIPKSSILWIELVGHGGNNA